jgi:hypothetical protein
MILVKLTQGLPDVRENGREIIEVPLPGRQTGPHDMRQFFEKSVVRGFCSSP